MTAQVVWTYTGGADATMDHGGEQSKQIPRDRIHQERFLMESVTKSARTKPFCFSSFCSARAAVRHCHLDP